MHVCDCVFVCIQMWSEELASLAEKNSSESCSSNTTQALSDPSSHGSVTQTALTLTAAELEEVNCMYDLLLQMYWVDTLTGVGGSEPCAGSECEAYLQVRTKAYYILHNLHKKTSQCTIAE